MNITEIRVRLMEREDSGYLRAFVSVTFDELLVVHDIKVVEVGSRLFMAMPSRVLSIRCPACNGKNPWIDRDRYCGDCGELLPDTPPQILNERKSPYLDICHPITQKGREWIESCVLAAYWDEVRQHGHPRAKVLA